MLFSRLILLSSVFFLWATLRVFADGPANYLPEDPVVERFTPEVINATIWKGVDNPKLSNRDMRFGTEMEESIWQAKLMVAYIDLMRCLTYDEGLKLAKEQGEWEGIQQNRIAKYMDREQYGAEGVLDQAEEYGNLVRWRVARLEERADEINRESEKKSAASSEEASTEVLFPASVVPSINIEEISVAVAKARPGKESEGLSAEGVQVMKAVWGAKLLSIYLEVLRTLPPQAAKALAEEQTKWYEDRFDPETKVSKWKEWKEVTQKRVAELEARLPKPKENGAVREP